MKPYCPNLTVYIKSYYCIPLAMKPLVNDIIVPYFDQKKEEHGLCSLWTIDCWSVHKLEGFRGWIKNEHPTVIIFYVPGECAGLWQPLDVGIQHILKQSMKRSTHKDIVTEMTTQLCSGTPAAVLKLDTILVTLCNRSVQWIMNNYCDINNKNLILKVGWHSFCSGLWLILMVKAFEMCEELSWLN